jgi:ubiquinone/menaquinone biosynthesis C-methylase UbiE
MKDKEFVGFEALSKEQLWTLCMAEYDTANPAIKMLINNFYTKIEEIIISLNNCNTFFEVGCGAGESSRRIHKMLPAGKTIEVSDFDNRYVELLNEKKMPFKVTRESIYDIQKPDNSYDCVICLEVMEHLEDPEKAIKELFRVASKTVIISVPNEPIWRIANMARLKYLKDFGNTPGHINHFNSGSLKRLAEKYVTKAETYKSFPWLILHATKK